MGVFVSGNTTPQTYVNGLPPQGAPGEFDAADVNAIWSALVDVRTQAGVGVNVLSFGAAGGGSTDDSAIILLAATAAAGRRLFFPAGTYRISQNIAINATVIWFEAGAKLAIDGGITVTMNGRVISLGGDPTTGTGTIVYGNAVNLFANDNGFSFSKTPSVGTDDFFHIRRDIQGSTGIIIRNDDDVGTTSDSYIHLYGGPLTGPTLGSTLRLSAANQAHGLLVNIVAENASAFSLIQQAAAPLDLYTANVRQFQIASVPSAVNYWQFKGGLATSSISLAAAGTDTNVSIVHNSKGNGSHFFRTGATPAFQLEVKDTAAAANRLTITGGTNPTIGTSGGSIAFGKATVPTRTVLTYSATIATDASLGNSFSITATNGTAFTISDPTNLSAGQRVLYTIRNTSGGALGAITWGATAFKMPAFTAPANGNSRSVEFIHDGTNLIQLWQSAADVPN